MATKKNISASSTKAQTPAVKATIPPDAVSTPVRNTTVPPKTVSAIAAPAKKSPPTYDAIAARAFAIWQSSGGNEVDNWVRAERELSAL